MQLPLSNQFKINAPIHMLNRFANPHKSTLQFDTRQTALKHSQHYTLFYNIYNRNIKKHTIKLTKKSEREFRFFSFYYEKRSRDKNHDSFSTLIN